MKKIKILCILSLTLIFLFNISINSMAYFTSETLIVASDTKHKVVSPVSRDLDHTAGEMINDADSFIKSSDGEEKISQESLKDLSNTIYNILLVIGIAAAVIIGAVLGFKFITEGVEGQVDVKKALVPYLVGCVIVFGAFTIWKIVVTVLNAV